MCTLPRGVVYEERFKVFEGHQSQIQSVWFGLQFLHSALVGNDRGLFGIRCSVCLAAGIKQKTNRSSNRR